MAISDSTTKMCPRCRRELPLTSEFFGANRAEKNGFNSYCKSCWREIGAERRARMRATKGIELVPDGFRLCGVCKSMLPATREYFTTNSKGKGGLQSFCRACGAKQQKAYRQDHPERVSTTERMRSLNEKRRNWQREWSKKAYHADARKSEKTRNKNLRRRARIKGASGSHTKADELAQYQKQSGKCWWCGIDLENKYEADHVIPISRGGSDDRENIVISCIHCNRSKHNKLSDEWKATRQ